MNVKKCDRCGGIYDCEKGGFVLIADKKERRRDNVFFITYNGENVDQRDLCRNCLDNFKNWFEQNGNYSTKGMADCDDMAHEVSGLGF